MGFAFKRDKQVKLEPRSVNVIRKSSLLNPCGCIGPIMLVHGTVMNGCSRLDFLGVTREIVSVCQTARESVVLCTSVPSGGHAKIVVCELKWGWYD